MATAFICLARADLADNGLQVTDLWPNTSQKSAIYEPGLGQTGYMSMTPQNDTVATTGAGPITTNAAYSGIAAWMMDNIENVGGGNIPLTPAIANAIGPLLLARVVAGQSMSVANVNAAIVAAGAAASGIGVGNSTGTLADVLKLLQGYAYVLPANSQIDDGAGAFAAPHTAKGSFVTTGASGRNLREYERTGALHISRSQGVLSKLAAATYTFLDPLLTYGAGGTALFVDGTAIPTTGAGAAVVVYDAVGTVIT